MRELKSKVLKCADYKSIKILDKLPKFNVDIEKFEKDIKRCQYAHGMKEEIELVEKDTLVNLTCESIHPRFNSKNKYVVVGRNVWDKEFEEQLIGCGKGKTQLNVHDTNILVDIKSIVRTRIPELTDENVRSWEMDGIFSVEDLKKYYVARQIASFREDVEEAEMVTSYLFLEYLKTCEFDFDEEEIAAMRKTVDKQFNEAKRMREELIQKGEIDPNEKWDIFELFEDMIYQSLKASTLGYHFMKEENCLPTLDKYQETINIRAKAYNITSQEMKNRYTELDFMLEECSEFFFNRLEAYVGDIMKEEYYEQNKERLEPYDVAIIGAGPAGLSAALTLNVHHKKMIWFGTNDLSNKVEVSERIINYAGFSSITGKELNQQFRSQIEKNNLILTDKMVSNISINKNEFMILADNEIYKAKTVLLTIGAVAPKGIENEHELLGHGVSYCATCDGFLYDGKDIAVYCSNPRYEHEVEYLANIANKVYLYTSYKQSNVHLENVIHLEKPMKSVLGNEKVEGIVLTDGSRIAVDGAFFLRDSVAPSTMLKELKIDGAHILTTRNMETNINGCYAAGDITGRPYQIAKAVGEGNIAAHSIVEYLSKR